MSDDALFSIANELRRIRTLLEEIFREEDSDVFENYQERLPEGMK